MLAFLFIDHLALEIIPNPGEIADIKCDEEASRYIALAMEIMNLLGN